MNYSSNSTNETSNAHSINTTSLSRLKSYVFNPVNLDIKLGIACPSIAAGFYSLVANVLVLYFMYKKSKIVQNSSFRRRTTDHFITSLALSDVMCSLLSLPVFVAEIFVDFITTDLICKLCRYIVGFFPFVTCMNYLFIGIDRFMMIYFPYKVPSKSTSKRLVLASWLAGALITLMPMPAMIRSRFDFANNEYTIMCVYGNSNRILVVATMLFVYVIPSITLITTSVMIVRKMRRQRTTLQSNDATPNQQNARETTMRFKVHYMFIFLIFAFVIPYLSFVCYNTAAILLKLNTSFTTDYATRIFSVGLMHSNGAVSATVFFCQIPFLRNGLARLFRSIIPRKAIETSNNQTNSAE